jgi:hypothetical protein
MALRILFHTTPSEDYLQDSLLIGLKRLPGVEVVDAPAKRVLYQDYPAERRLYGNGFTLYRTLPPILAPPEGPLDPRRFDLRIFGRIWKQKRRWLSTLLSGAVGPWTPTVLLDGEDRSRLFPVRFRATLFKRERYGRVERHSQPIGFSVPREKIRRGVEEKTKTWGRHVQCQEAFRIAEVARCCTAGYAFDQETPYYDDLASARYGITMKKAGWDCMRHYEIAAAGAVPAFYRLGDKPAGCAPHGLVDLQNCLAFDTAEELEAKVADVEARGAYGALRRNALAWAEAHACDQAARDLLRTVGFDPR